MPDHAVWYVVGVDTLRLLSIQYGIYCPHCYAMGYEQNSGIWIPFKRVVEKVSHASLYSPPRLATEDTKIEELREHCPVSFGNLRNPDRHITEVTDVHFP